MGLIEIRFSGDPKDVEYLAQKFRNTGLIAKESKDYTNRDGSGVRRYISIIVNNTEEN